MALVAKWSKRYNKISRTQLRAVVDGYSRAPFQDALAEFLSARPTMENITIWAAAHPDRWANAVALFSKMSGYTEKMEIVQDVFHHIADMSDADLLQKLQDLQSNYNLVNKPVALIPADNSITTIDQEPEKKDKKRE